MSKSVLPMFASQIFKVSSLTFWTLIHFEFTFGVSESSNFIVLYVIFQFSQYHLLKSLFFFSIVYSCLFYHRLSDRLFPFFLVSNPQKQIIVKTSTKELTPFFF